MNATLARKFEKKTKIILENYEKQLKFKCGASMAPILFSYNERGER